MAGERGAVRPDSEQRRIGIERKPVRGRRGRRREIRAGIDRPETAHSAPDAAQAAHNRPPVAILRRTVGLRPQHCVGQLDNAVGPLPAGRQHRGIRQVFLFAEHRIGRTQPKIPTALGVKQSTEYRGRVVIGQTPPADRPIGRNDRRGAAVANHPQALDRWIRDERRPAWHHRDALRTKARWALRSIANMQRVREGAVPVRRGTDGRQPGRFCWVEHAERSRRPAFA